MIGYILKYILKVFVGLVALVYSGMRKRNLKMLVS